MIDKKLIKLNKETRNKTNYLLLIRAENQFVYFVKDKKLFKLNKKTKKKTIYLLFFKRQN